jgi:hypothetical protein
MHVKNFSVKVKFKMENVVLRIVSLECMNYSKWQKPFACFFLCVLIHTL